MLKKILLIVMMSAVCLSGWSADKKKNKDDYYTIIGTSLSPQGHPIVEVTSVTKDNPTKYAQDQVLKDAVMGVIFKGVESTNSSAYQKPIITNADVLQTKAAFFEAFENEKQYTRFATLVPQTLTVMKNKATKKYEATASVIVDTPALRKYLEEKGIIQGFDSLW